MFLVAIRLLFVNGKSLKIIHCVALFATGHCKQHITHVRDNYALVQQLYTPVVACEGVQGIVWGHHSYVLLAIF